ncbi:Uma2 family endonuclease [Sphingomonas sp. UV9]|uniref:Uma2 family endonuclease n=1 Tax=Sphingomonas sp. UV9 TaxID=1851410 RepID=UPI000FFBF5A4|nr:Uma2 family endonuclease [Sphingomonas sp. UV9]RXD03437.1 Uma2 family endonuclease [Sphingomonas sp. UV9]
MNTSAASLLTDRQEKARFTTAEFLRMGESGAFDDMKVELVDGELVRMNSPMSAHAARQAKIAIRLARLFDESRIMGEVGVDLGNDTVLGCDVAVVREPVGANRLLVAADFLLVIEVAETSAARDTTMKRFAYAGGGIPHYWVIDGSRSVVHVYGAPIKGDYTKFYSVGFGEAFAVPETDGTITID